MFAIKEYIKYLSTINRLRINMLTINRISIKMCIKGLLKMY